MRELTSKSLANSIKIDTAIEAAKPTVFDVDGGRLVQANFMLGSREAPQPMMQSTTCTFTGGHLVPGELLASSAAVDVASFKAGATHIVLANSLSTDLRFSTDSIVYRIEDTRHV